MSRIQGFQAVALFLFTAPAAFCQGGADPVRLEVGESRSSTFRTQADGVRASSADPSIASVRFDGHSRVTIAGVTPGTTTVTVSGEVVRYQTGIPGRQPGRRVNAVPVQVRTPFTHTYSVEVVASPSRRAAARPAADANGRHVRVRVGQSRTDSFDRQVVGVTVEGNDPSIADVQVRDDEVVITGVAPGTTRVTVRGRTVRYQTGIPSREPGRRVNRVPLRVEEPLEETWTIEVYALPAREERRVGDEGREDASPAEDAVEPMEEGWEPADCDRGEESDRRHPHDEPRPGERSFGFGFGR